MTFIKSCINYTGGKYRLLKQILPYFPKDIENFIDLFCGGGNVSLNVDSTNIFCFDINKPLIDLFNFIKKESNENLLNGINSIIEEYNLSKSEYYGYEYYQTESNSGLAKYNKKNYLKLRNDFNENNFNNFHDKCLYFYTLIVYGFNNQIRFNKKGKYNIPVGKRDFNVKTKENLLNFSNHIKQKNIIFKHADFRSIDFNKMGEKDFIYLDPPYLISLASYNEQNGWTEKDEIDLLKILDFLDSRNIKFALSNVFENKEKVNTILIEWAKDFNVNYLNYNYNNSNYQIKNKNSNSIEVLITNF